MYRHGDLLILASKIPDGAKAVKSNVLAKGTATGHSHTIVAEPKEPKPAIYKFENKMWIECKGKSFLKHQEHATIPIPPGTYEVRRQVEYVPSAPPRQVED